MPTAAFCSCPSPACPAPFACVQPPRKYLHFAKHECTQTFAGRVQPSYSTASYGYPPPRHTVPPRTAASCPYDPCVLTATLHTPSPAPSPTHPTHPPTIHTDLGTGTHKNSQCTHVYRTCTYSRVLQLPFACLSCTLRLGTAGSQVPPLCQARVHTNIRGTRTALLPHSLLQYF